MTYLLCSIFNKDTKEYSAPFLEKSKKSAVHKFLYNIEKELEKDHKFPCDDLSIVMLGTFDIVTGKIDVLGSVELACGSDWEEDKDPEV